MKPDGKTRRPGTPSGAGRHTRGPHLAALTRINHDLRSPLSVILGVLELLEASTSLRESERRYVGLASEAAAELLSQADAIRLYTAMARNLVSLEADSVDIRALARERLLPAFESRHVVIEEVAGDAARVLADPGYLGVALAALARHLAAHMRQPDHGAPLRLALDVSGQDAGTVLLSLKCHDAPEPAPAETPEPGQTDLAVVNAVALVTAMRGRVRMNPEQPYLLLDLPAAASV